MFHRRCPACASKDAAFLEQISKAAHVDYYRCRYCGHVWNIAKHELDTRPRHVTPLPDDKVDGE